MDMRLKKLIIIGLFILSLCLIIIPQAFRKKFSYWMAILPARTRASSQ